MIFQLRKPLFDSEELFCAIWEFRAGNASIDLLDEKYRRPSRLRNARSKSRRFSFCICDRGTRDHPYETEPAFIGFPVALRRAKAETTQAGHHSLPKTANALMASRPDRTQ
jgi:hypothetical protein